MPSLAKDGSIDVTFDGNCAILTYKCGENRLNSEFVKKFNDALDKVESNGNITALITTGQGKFYSNGIDLDWLHENPDRAFHFTHEELIPLLIRLLTFPVLTVAAINGHAYAGGALLALAHDLRVMRTERGRICMNEVHIHLMFNKPLTEILRAKVPSGKIFHKFVVLGIALGAEEAMACDIIDVAVHESQLMNQCKVLITQTFQKNGPYKRQSLSNMKEDMIENVILSHRKLAAAKL